LWARCMLGSDLIPRSLTIVVDLGIVGAAIYGAISSTSTHHAVTRTRRRMSSLLNSQDKVLGPHAINCCQLSFICLTKLVLSFSLCILSSLWLGSGCRHARQRQAVAQWLIHFSRHPQSVQ
jgi:hypothetical protein